MTVWTWDPQRMAWTADFGPMRAEVWSQGGWPWIVGVRGKDGDVAMEVARNVKICAETLDPNLAKLAAETAARQYADAIRAALPLTIATVITSPRFLTGEVYAETTIDRWTYQYKASTNGRGEPALCWRCRRKGAFTWAGLDAVWHADRIGLATLLRSCTEVEAES